MPTERFRFRLNDEVLEPHHSGALYWPDQSTLIVADLHLEKAASIAARGQLLPPYDSIETLNRLENLCQIFAPKRLIALGDSFHDPTVIERLSPQLRNRLQLLGNQLELLWICGNHDPHIPAYLGGRAVQDWQLQGLQFRHQADARGQPRGEVSGHYHPKACTLIANQRYSKPVFVADETRVILPAFGAFTGGLWVHNPAIYTLFGAQMQTFFCAKNRVMPIPMSKVVPRT